MNIWDAIAAAIEATEESIENTLCHKEQVHLQQALSALKDASAAVDAADDTRERERARRLMLSNYYRTIIQKELTAQEDK